MFIMYYNYILELFRKEVWHTLFSFIDLESTDSYKRALEKGSMDISYGRIMLLGTAGKDQSLYNIGL